MDREALPWRRGRGSSASRPATLDVVAVPPGSIEGMSSAYSLIVLAFLAGCNSKSAKPDPWGSSDKPSSAPVGDPWGAAGDNKPPPSAEPPVPTTPAAQGQNIGLPQGEWRCYFESSSWMSGARYTQTIEMNGFTVHGEAFTSKEGDGTFELDGLYLVMHGGGFDGWRGAFNVHQDRSPYLVFGGKDHRDAQPGKGANIGDVTCEPKT
jgi:hypothetical protein